MIAKSIKIFAVLSTFFFTNSSIAQVVENNIKSKVSDDDKVIELKPFMVRNTQGMGYTPGNTGGALKNSQPMMEIPAQILVVSNDLLRDISPINTATSDTLQYVGVGSFYKGETAFLRGQRVSGPYLDDSPDVGFQSDSANIDSYEVIKGPVQMFYPGAALSGTILKISKKPLSYAQHSIQGSISEHGNYRAVFDSTAPIGKLGSGNLAYRFVAAHTGGGSFFQNLKEDHNVMYASFKWEWEKASVFIAADQQAIDTIGGGASMLTPDFKLYTGWGRSQAGTPKNAMLTLANRRVRGSLNYRLSENWNALVTAAWIKQTTEGVASYASSVNWANNTAAYSAYYSLPGNGGNSVILQSDLRGKYSIFDFKQESALGFFHYDQTSYGNSYSKSLGAISINSNAINAIIIPAVGPNPNVPNRSKSYNDNFYYVHQTEVIPGRLTVIGGASFNQIENVSIANTSTAQTRRVATNSSGHAPLHRFGAVLNITKDVMFYALESSTYQTSGRVDFKNSITPNVDGLGRELGIKTAFWNGRLSSTITLYSMDLSNQPVINNVIPNEAGIMGWSERTQTTTSKGWDGFISFQPVRGWELIGTFYNGKIRDPKGNALNRTYENAYSLFTRYNFNTNPNARAGLSIGGGITRIGAKYQSTGGITLPVGYTPYAIDSSGTSLLKLQTGTQVTAFISYNFSKKLNLRINCSNILDEAFPIGAQGVALVDPSEPRTFSFSVQYKL